MLSWIKAMFAPLPLAYERATRLDGTSKNALLQSLRTLFPEQRGWVTYDEARALFSKADREYAFGETDQAGNQTITAFAAFLDARVEFMPADNRVYFQRIALSDATDARGKFSVVR